MRVWVVPHTHWDREWYLPFEQFRIHLARLIDDVLDALEQDPALCFTMDGQAVLLEDYLEIRPAQEARLRALLASGRLAMGPSYVLPDEFLVGQESLIRNLMMGRQVCVRLGASPMAAAYAPDTFGHVAQLPQLLRGFGIDSFIFWRGLGDEAERLGTVFHWQAPDGSQVLAVRLLEGYANARDLGRWSHRDGWVRDEPSMWPGLAASRVGELLERWRRPMALAGLRDLLLCNGVDHQPLQRDLPQMLAACKEAIPDATFIISTYEGYVDGLRWRVGELQSHQGELVGGKEACVVRSVNSTRIYLKQANEAVERALFVAEILASLAWLKERTSPPASRHGEADMSGGTRPYPLNELRLAWRELLRNHPHDSLPGCSVDEVHRDMEQRFRSAAQIAALIQRESLASLAGRAAGLRTWEDPQEPPSVVNVLPWNRVGVVELPLPSEMSGWGRWAWTSSGPLPIQIHGVGAERRALVALEVPGFGTRQLDPTPERGDVFCHAERSEASPGARRSFAGAQDDSEPPKACFSPARVSDRATIENGFYRVEAAPNGTLVVTDLRTGQIWEGFHRFEDVADKGDEYSFCPVAGDTPWDSRSLTSRVRVRARGPVVAELEVSLAARLPRGLAANRKGRSKSTTGCPIRTIVRLAAGVDRIEFRTTVANRASDHRLRVLFPAPDSDQTIRAEGHFALLRRPAQPEWDGCWREPPAKTHHTLGTVAAGKLALMSRGLPEYEAVPNGTGGVDLALTLLRCVGWLSWPDLETRPGAEDPHLPTPEAQCQGVHTFEYALSLRGEADDVSLMRAGQDYRVGLLVGPAGVQMPHLGFAGQSFGFAALKGAEDGQGVILRLHNPAPTDSVVQIDGPGLEARRCRLDETGTEADPTAIVQMRGGEIATLRLTVAHRQRGSSHGRRA